VTALPEANAGAVRAWCSSRVPDHARDQVHLDCEVTDRHLTIVERRLPYGADGPNPPADVGWTRWPIARLRYTRARSEWTLCLRDRNLRFHRHNPTLPIATITDLLAAIDRDRSGIFFG